MTKILNLDEFEHTVDKSVILSGKTHKYHPLTVEDFISQSKEIERAQKENGENMPLADYANFLITTVNRAFPTMEESDLRKLSVEQLKALFEFVRGVEEPEIEENKESLEEATKGNE